VTAFVTVAFSVAPAVVTAHAGAARQPVGQEILNHFVHRPAHAQQRGYPPRAKKFLGMLAHSARNNVGYTHLREVPGQETRLVPGVGNDFLFAHLSAGINRKQGKFRTVPEVGGYKTSLTGYGNLHEIDNSFLTIFFCFFCTLYYEQFL
jgi:hypothetical protein